jgi:hypothetical protein
MSSSCEGRQAAVPPHPRGRRHRQPGSRGGRGRLRQRGLGGVARRDAHRAGLRARLGLLRIGTFPPTAGGSQARLLCDEWAGLRGQYASQVSRDTPFELEQWFSAPTWHPAFAANSPLRIDPDYLYISGAFGLVSTAAAASLDNARLLDAACAAAD